MAVLFSLMTMFAITYAIPMQLHMMNNEVRNGAVCLDGTAAGFYFSPATTKQNSNDWQIYFTGGGWCYDEMDCYGRSSTTLGSSKDWPPSSSLGGMLSDDCRTNPDFCNFNRVQLAYCDGNSFSGDRDLPVIVNNTSIYFRGRRILDAVIRSLVPLGLSNAVNILLTGCSAGGLSTYLHADYVHSLVQGFPSLQRYKAAPISGFFLLHDTVEQKSVYPTEMQYIFNLANSTNGLNKYCMAAKAPSDQWMCNFAQEAYAYTQVPIFALNSALDSWQTLCILTSELVPGFPNQDGTANGDCGAVPGWGECAKNVDDCTTAQMPVVNAYIADFSTIMNSTATYSKAGNGAFIHSCLTHCEAQGDTFNTFKINGVSMQQALGKWWASPITTPANDNNYVPCFYNDLVPRQCNPTCGN